MNPLSPYKTLIEAFLLVLVLAAIGFGFHLFLEYERGIGYDRAKAEYTAKELVATQAARATEQRLSKQLEDAQNAAIAREQTLTAAAAASASAAGSLRNTVATLRNSLPGATVETARQAATAFATVFTDCTDRYRGMAEIADRHASDAKTLSEAWPK